MLKKVLSRGFPLFIAVTLLYKIYVVEQYVMSLTGHYGYTDLVVLQNDAVIFSLMLFLYILSTYKYSILQFVLRFSIVFIFLVYFLDIIILRNFFAHITVQNFFQYLPDAYGFIVDIFITVLTVPEILITIIVLLLFIIFASHFVFISRESDNTERIVLFSLSIIMLVLFITKGDKQYIHSWIYKNIFEYNLQVNNIDAQYSDDFIKKLLLQEKDLLKQQCHPKATGGKDIVVVILESLSMYHSRHFSNLNNITPYIDKIARDNISFKNFYANGFNTEDGLISLLLGIPPICGVNNHSVKDVDTFEGLYNVRESIALKLSIQGYKTEFMTSGDINFSNKKNWLQSIGFDYIEGNEHQEYAKWPRFHFRAAPDQALYLRAVDRIFNIKREHPYCMIIETVSTHLPFINPVDGSRSELGAFTYADRELFKFYMYLKKRDFFKTGILIVVGDHRGMTPLTKAEIDLYSHRASALVPLIVCNGIDSNEVVNEPFQQLDLYSGIINYASNKQCISRWRGDLLNIPRIPAEYIFHVSGHSRNIVNIFCDEKRATVKLNGDKTSLVTGDINNPQLAVDWINYLRVQRKN